MAFHMLMFRYETAHSLSTHQQDLRESRQMFALRTMR